MFNSNNTECTMFFHFESNEFLQLFIWPLYNFFYFCCKMQFLLWNISNKIAGNFRLFDFFDSYRKSVFFWCFCHQSFLFLLLAFEKMLCYFLIKLFTIEELPTYFLKLKLFFMFQSSKAIKIRKLHE